MGNNVPVKRSAWLKRWATDVPTRTGAIAAAWSLPGSLARGLQPRSPVDQAIASGVVVAFNFQMTAATWASVAALAAVRPGRRATPVTTLAVAGGALLVAAAAAKATEKSAPDSLIAATCNSAAHRLGFSAIAGASATVWDHVLHTRLKLEPGIDTTLLPNIATGAVLASGLVIKRQMRARKYGDAAPDRKTVNRKNRKQLVQALGIGAATAVGLTALTVGEQFAAHQIERVLGKASGGDAGALGNLIAHGLILGGLTAGGVVGLRYVTSELQQRDDIVEPAYPQPPTSPYVSAGPRSAIPFDSMGKEGRRFVLMALDAESIEQVMGEKAVDPVRVVGGYESAPTVEERARLMVQDLKALGGFDRSLICIGSPTGVGYLNYTVTEALEYLARGDCATVVPQYALVPSALALPKTSEGISLTRMVISSIREEIESMPPHKRPRLVLFGESLGANIALDSAKNIPEMDRLDIESGLYLGVPFRTAFWKRWRPDHTSVDPDGRVVLVADAVAAVPDPANVTISGSHVMVIHDDDPVNKYNFTMIFQQPWWLGPPMTRPPLVPRETRFRPITSFVLATVDIKNGMQSKPGEFIRRGHDYRIDARAGLQLAFGLPASQAQVDAIETALREREQEWATIRMVARNIDRAKRAISQTLAAWGQKNVIDLADLDPASMTVKPSLVERLGSTPVG